MLSESPAWLIETVRGLVSESAEARESNADGVSYWCDYGTLRGDECPVLAGVCAWAALVETAFVGGEFNFSVRESFLSALYSFEVDESAPQWALGLVAGLDSNSQNDPNHEDAAVQDEASTTGASNPAWLLGMVRDLTTQFSLSRRRGLEDLTNAVTNNEIFAHEAATLAGIVGWLAVIDEKGSRSTEPLECLTAVATHGLVPTATVDLVTSELPREQASENEREAYNTFVAAVRGQERNPNDGLSRS